MAEIVVTDLNNVLVDGKNAGAITDVLSNYGKEEGIRSDILRAFADWDAGRDAAHTETIKALGDQHAEAVKVLSDQHAEDLAKVQTEADTAQAALRESHAAELAKVREEADAAQAKVADQATLIDAMGGTPYALELKRQAEKIAAIDARDRAEAAKAEAVARIAELDAKAVDPGVAEVIEPRIKV